MNQNIIEQFEAAEKSAAYQAQNIAESLANVKLARHFVASLEGEISDKVDVNAYGGSIWINVYCREDLQHFMRLSPRWEKSNKELEGVIAYKATIAGIQFSLHAHDAALPPTCKVVEEEYTIPATEARVGKRMVIKCNEDINGPTSAIPPTTDEQLDNGAPTDPSPSELLSPERSLVEITK